MILLGSKDILRYEVLDLVDYSGIITVFVCVV